MSNLRPLLVRWHEDIRLTTRSSCAPARAAPRRSTTAAAVSPDGVTAARGAARRRGASACVRRRPGTTTAAPTRAGRSTGAKRRRDGPGVPRKSWGITAATRNQESYEHCPRRRLTPPGRSSMPHPSTQSQRQPPEYGATNQARSYQRPRTWPGCWSRGPSCSLWRGDEPAALCAALFVADKAASSRSSPLRSGGTGLDAGAARIRDV
jgi:hypothetical protein